MKPRFWSVPESSKEIRQDPELALEEYKILTTEAQFVMTRYMQMLALYLFAIGALVSELVQAPDLTITVLWIVGLTILNFGAFYGARRFRSMAYHSLNRLALLAEHFRMQKPHPMIWGNRAGVGVFLSVQFAGFTYLAWFLLSSG